MTSKQKVKKIIAILEKHFPGAKTALRYGNNWELLVAVILSAQCTDKKVNEVTSKLFRKYRILDDYVRAKQSAFEQDIRAAGFYRNKAKNILAAAKTIQEKFGGKLPRTMKEMCTIPGVGRKTANIVLGIAYGVVEGIAVDTHVRRLSRRLGLTRHTDPEKIERDLMKIVPQKYWLRFNYLLVDYGRKFCPSRKHDHAKCPLAEFDV